jgi:hypothetical protein
MRLIAAYIPYEASDRQKYGILSHLTAAEVIVVLLVCAALFVWLFKRRR